MIISVLIVDDHSVVSAGIKALLSSERDMRVIGIATNGREGLQMIETHKPDVVLLDIAMPNMNGIEALSHIRSISPKTRALILSMHANREYIQRAMNGGACGYMLKESAGGEVANAIRTVAFGHQYFSPSIRDLCEKPGTAYKNPLDTLSQREREVLQLTVEGKTSAEIAALLYLSPKSVETYRSRLMRKLKLDNLPDLVKFAIQHGITPLN